MSSTNTIINPKPCNYGCGTRIYWNTSENTYLEVFTKKRHSCPNRSKSVTQTPTTNANKPTYYNKFAKQPDFCLSSYYYILKFEKVKGKK